MKFPAAYYLLLLYCTVMIRCAMPVACDALSHIFNEEEHLAIVHAVYGSHHLQSEISDTVSDNHSAKHSAEQQQNEPTIVHTFTETYRYGFKLNQISSPQCNSYFCFLPKGLPAVISQPPENC